jgi:hypothetical protein
MGLFAGPLIFVNKSAISGSLSDETGPKVMDIRFYCALWDYSFFFAAPVKKKLPG